MLNLVELFVRNQEIKSAQYYSGACSAFYSTALQNTEHLNGITTSIGYILYHIGCIWFWLFCLK